MPYCTDWYMYKRVAVYGPVWYEPKCLVRWRQHTGSATSRLKSRADDLIDRRKSIELSKAYLPASVETASSNTALKTSLLWATDILRESITQDNFLTALAQAREILGTLQQLTSTDSNTEGRSLALPEDPARLQAQVDWLEAQVQAWIRAAEALRTKQKQVNQ